MKKHIILLLFFAILPVSIIMTACGGQQGNFESSVTRDTAGDDSEFEVVSDSELVIEETLQTVQPDAGGKITLDESNIQIDIAPHTLQGTPQIEIINGFSLDDIDDENARETIESLISTISIPLDTYQVLVHNGSITGSLKVTFDLSRYQEDIDVINQSLKEEISGYQELTIEDIDIIYLDTWLRLLTPMDYERDGSLATLRSHYEGIFFIAINEVTLNEIGKRAYQQYIESTAKVHTTQSAISSRNVEYHDQPNYVSHEENDYGLFTTACSTKLGAIATVLQGLYFNDACLNHDNCYAYGKYTYGFNNRDCNNQFLEDLFGACNTKYYGERRNKRYRCSRKKGLWGKVRRMTCKLGQKTRNAWVKLRPRNHVFWLLCRTEARAMKVAVDYGVRNMGYGIDGYHNSGCYDYRDKGVECEVGRINYYVVNGKKYYDNTPAVAAPGETTQVEVKLFKNYNNDNNNFNYDRTLQPDKVEWELTPLETEATEYGALSRAISDDTIDGETDPVNTWDVPNNEFVRGLYAITARLFYEGRLIDTKTVQILVSDLYEDITNDYDRILNEYQVKTGRHCSGMLWWKKCSNTYTTYTRYEQTLAINMISRNNISYVHERITIDENGTPSAGNTDSYRITAYDSHGTILWKSEEGQILHISSAGNREGVFAIEKIDNSFQLIHYNSTGTRQSLLLKPAENNDTIVSFFTGSDGSGYIYYIHNDALYGMKFDSLQVIENDSRIYDSILKASVRYHDNQFYMAVITSDNTFHVVSFDADLNLLWDRFRINGIFHYAETGDSSLVFSDEGDITVDINRCMQVYGRDMGIVISELQGKGIDQLDYVTRMDIVPDVDGSVYVSLGLFGTSDLKIYKFSRMGMPMWRTTVPDAWDFSSFHRTQWYEYNIGHLVIYNGALNILTSRHTGSKNVVNVQQIDPENGLVSGEKEFIPNEYISGFHIANAAVCPNGELVVHGSKTNQVLDGERYINNDWLATTMIIKP